MKDAQRREFLQLLCDIDQQMADAKRLAATAPAEDVLRGASAVVQDLRAALARVEALLRADERQ